jgi:chromosome segregation ATPase
MAVERKDIEIFFKIEGLEAYITDLETLDSVLKQVDTATTKAKEATNELETATESFDGLEEKLQTMEGGVKTLAGSFEFLAGAASLLGLEDNPFFKELSENVVGVLALSRGAIDAAEGVRLLAQNQKLATAAQSAFNLVAKANPYVLLASAVIALAGAILLYNNRTVDSTENVEKYNRSLKNLQTELEKTTGFERELAEARGEFDFEEQIAFNDREAAQLEYGNKLLTDRAIALTKLDRSDEQQAELDQINADIKANNIRLQQIKDENILIAEREKTKQKEAAAEKKIEEQREANRKAEERRNKQKQLEAELTLKAIEDDRLRDLESLRRKYDADVALAKGNAELIKLVNEQLQRDIQAINEKYALKEAPSIEPVKKQVIAVAELVQTASTSVTDFADRSADAWSVSYKKAFDQVIEEPSKAAALLQRDVKAAIDFATNLNTIFAKDNEKRAERTFNLNKALGITSAVINTAEAITAALTDKTQPSTILRIAQAAAVAAAGAAQIATISRTKFSPDSTDTPDVPTPLPPSGVNNPGTTQLPGQTTGETPSSIQGGPIRAYVLVSDVNSAQQANSQIENLVKL